MQRSAVWDQHTCLPLDPHTDLTRLARYAGAGGRLLSINVGYALHSGAVSRALLDGFRAGIDGLGEGYLLPASSAELAPAVADDRIAVVFDLEDCAPLDGDLAALAQYAALGVRSLAPTYNHANAAGCGCLDAVDTGLTDWGRRLVAELNAVGIVPDGSHCSVRTGLDMCAATAKPMVYSHSCLRSVWEHPRNITDDQARACAATGGVVGITGVGIFLGPNTPTVPAMIRHLEAAVELVGIDHVGVSTDYSFDEADFRAEIDANPQLFDESYTRWGPIEWMPPETFLTLGAALRERGWPEADISAVLWDNFHRVATATW
jgi:membrane dipeptidase